MPFGLKNAGATYQHTMNSMFHDMIGRFMEIYINDVVAKTGFCCSGKSFERLRKYELKMNP